MAGRTAYGYGSGSYGAPGGTSGSSGGYWTNPLTGGKTYLGSDGKAAVPPPEESMPITLPADDLGRVRTYTPQTQSGAGQTFGGSWTTAYVPGSQVDSGTDLSYGGGGSSRAAAAPAAPKDNSAMFERLLAEVKGGAPTINRLTPTPYSGGPTPHYDKGAEDAAYARAKDRTGLALQAAMKGLSSSMNKRGIGGSGIEAENLTDLYESGVGALGETDRQLAERSADRAFSAGESERGRAESARQFNDSFLQGEEDRAAEQQAQQLARIMQAYSFAF